MGLRKRAKDAYDKIVIDGKANIAKLSVDESYQPQNDTYKKFYHVIAIEISPASNVGTGFNQIAHLFDSGDTMSVAQLYEYVKTYDEKINVGKGVSPKVLNKDGTPYDVVFTIRDKGKEQYEYLVEFHKKRTPTAIRSLFQSM